MRPKVNISGIGFGLALLSVSLVPLMGGCAELRTFAQLSPADVVSLASESPCVVVTKGQPLQQVKACDHGTNLEIIAPGWMRSYKKADIHQAVTELFGQFETNPKLGPHGLTGAGADLWADVALTDPNDVRFVILLRTKNGLVLIREPLDLSQWHVHQDSLVFIPEFHYPSTKARKMGVVQLVPHHDVTKVQMVGFLESIETKSSSTSFRVEGTWPYLTLRTTPFTESTIIKLVGEKAQARDLIQHFKFVPAGEREGAKYRLMSMDLMSPSYGFR